MHWVLTVQLQQVKMYNNLVSDNIVKGVTITLTQACNLNCIYCYENHKSTKFMSFEKAKEIIDKELTSIKKNKNKTTTTKKVITKVWIIQRKMRRLKQQQ